jgi:hypothetical protein
LSLLNYKCWYNDVRAILTFVSLVIYKGYVIPLKSIRTTPPQPLNSLAIVSKIAKENKGSVVTP